MHPETPSDPPYQFLACDGSRIAYTDEGAGEQVLLAIPGLPGTVRDFRWLAPALSDVRFVRIDLPGFGQSSRSDYTGMSIAERAAPVLALIDALELASVTLVGHSSGGTVAAHLARYHADRIHRVVLIACPGPRAHYPAGVYRATAGLFAHRASRALVNPLQRVLYKALGFPSYLTDAERMYSTLDAAAAYFDTHTENLRHMTTATLVAWAADDRMIPPDIYRALEEVAPPGPRLRFPTGGHNIQKTRATELGSAIAQFVVE